MTLDSTTQHITRLMPRGEVLASIGQHFEAVEARRVATTAALGAVLAEDVIAAVLPPRAVALHDGFAVEAASVADAGPYAPVILPARRIESGNVLPEGADAILPFASAILRKDVVEVITGLAAGDGVLPTGGDATPQSPLRRAGQQIRSIDLGIFAAAGIETVVARIPRVTLACSNKALGDERFLLLSRAIRGAGGVLAEGPVSLETALSDNAGDVVIGVGGTGSGQFDVSVNVLARLGRIERHGVAISPGETAAFGWVGKRPVLLLPGRLDAMLASWLLIGRFLIAALTGGDIEDAPAAALLKRKVTSTIGMTELIPVSCVKGVAEPLASGYLSLASLANSDGWVEVPAASEGFAEGTLVAVNQWP